MTTIDLPRRSPPSPRLVSRFFPLSARQYHSMLADGIIPEGAATELLDGMIVYKDRADAGGDPMSHGPRHRMAVALLTELADAISGPQRHLAIQLPIAVDEFDEPEPDGAVVRGTPRQYKERVPAAGDVFCVIEVADSSLENDLEEKRRKYARAGIPQYVIIDLRHGRVEIFSQPNSAAETYAAKAAGQAQDILQIHLGDGEFLPVRAAQLLP